MSTQLDSSACDEVISESGSFSATEPFPLDYFFSKHVLKPKNVFKAKPKCLRRKLKKYKLRTDGREDQDILDISQKFLSTLKIQSPNKENLNNTEKLWPCNYLFKMARRKLKVKPECSNSTAKAKKLVTASTSPANNVEKTQTNAFKLLMDSRNKSIGTNSPGKEKNGDPTEIQDIAEKKANKAKRNLALQKMAETKGSLKKKELEEYEEQCIVKKMEKRAKRLKNMLTSPPPSNNKQLRKEVKKEMSPQEVVVLDDREDSKEADRENGAVKSKKKNLTNGVTKQSKTLQLINIFDQEKLEFCKSPEKKVSKEDKEFLKKLSPSIRKKENMLCYFRKIDKVTDPDENVIETEGSKSPIIKVRIKVKEKKKQKHKRLSLKRDAITDILKDHEENNSNNNNTPSVKKLPDTVVNGEKEPISTEKRKRKRREKLETATSEKPEPAYPIESVKVEDGRPKRNVKRPLKYTDDIQLSSSDDELLIFSTKKRKLVENGAAKRSKTNEIDISDSDNETNPKHSSRSKKSKEKDKKTAKPTKLAPIFSSKPQLNPAALEAKQKFLYSGIPEQLKKIVEQQKSTNIEFVDTFPVVVHVQQKKESSTELSLQELPFPIETESDQDGDQSEEDYKNLIGKLIDLTVDLHIRKAPEYESDVPKVLKDIKKMHPKFPVYRTYRMLRSKRKGEFKDANVDPENSVETLNDTTDMSNDNPETLTWTEKYKATSTKHLIGNFDTVKELKSWLIPWTERASTKKNNSDSSDFYDSDSNSRDSMRSMHNLLVLTGPVGSGKTSSVYAVANELSIKVIEVNASSKRTGKLMLQDLQEATQSHKVNRGTGSAENSQTPQENDNKFVLKTKKRGRPKKCDIEKTDTPTTQDSSRTALSLILIDDADIVFEQDDGFAAAITQLVQYSKRPVVLITASLSCPHLQRFFTCGNVLRMQPFLPRILGTWLDVLCLADNRICWPGLGAKVLDYFRGDARKTINSLQLFMAFQKQSPPEDSQNTDCRIDVEDETSSMSWPEQGTETRGLVPENNLASVAAYNHFVGKELSLLNPHQPLDLFDIWWSLPSLMTDSFTPSIENTEVEDKSSVLELEAISNLMDTMSVSDHICPSHSNSDLTSPPWFCALEDSVSEQENFASYDRNREDRSNLVQDLVRSTVAETQRVLGAETRTDICIPDMAAQRDKDRRISRIENFTSFLNPSSALDRRALALDYWSSCRQICRTEKGKMDTVSKRNNRYLHYLKSLNPVCKIDSFNRLGDSLS